MRKLMMFQVCYAIFCIKFVSHISLALTIETSNIFSMSDVLSPDRLIEPSCSLDDGPILKMQKCDCYVEEEGKMAGLDKCSESLHVFQPLHIISSWEEHGTTTKRLTLAILLPSGVCPGQFSVRVPRVALFWR